MKRQVHPALLLMLVTFLAVGAMTAVVACGANQRQDTLKASVIGLNVARDSFTAFDAAHQKTIVEKATTREDGEAGLAAWRFRRTLIVESFAVAYAALAVAATQTDDPSLRTALAASGELLVAIKKLTEGGL